MGDRQRLRVAIIIAAIVYTALVVAQYLCSPDVQAAALFALELCLLCVFVWATVAKDLEEFPPRQRRVARTLFWVLGALGVGSSAMVVWTSRYGPSQEMGPWLWFLSCCLLLAGDALHVAPLRVGEAWFVLLTGTLVWFSLYSPRGVKSIYWLLFFSGLVVLIHRQMDRLRSSEDGPDEEQQP
jgi:hypothetical protein